MSRPQFKAVIFDIGGVVLKSPLIAIANYERDLDLPSNYLNCSITGRGTEGAFQKFERGELDLLLFYKRWSNELSDAANGNKWYTEYCTRRGIECPKLPTPGSLKVNGRELFGLMTKDGGVYDPHILNAIRRIRAARKHRLIALTNNFTKLDASNSPPEELAFLGWDSEQGGPAPPALRALFDDFCDSSALGMRKPEPEFYLLACKRNGIHPTEAVFLDDIGVNLKAAAALGMQAIHVPLGGSLESVKKLEKLIGIDLTSPVGVDGGAAGGAKL